jgi:hypothetical protein
MQIVLSSRAYCRNVLNRNDAFEERTDVILAEGRKPVATNPAGVGHPPHALSAVKRLANMAASHDRSNNEFGGYLIPALGPPDESGGLRPG